jgi:AcrR family transcriptional regulator
MDITSKTRRPARGRPRSERARRAIIAAAAQLLHEQGLRAMTIEAVAARANVSKKTIYSWWPGKGALALDAFYGEWSGASEELMPDSGSVVGDLRLRARATVALMSSQRLGPTLAALLAEAQIDPELADAFHDHVLEPLREQARTLFLRAIARGELAPETDIEVAIDLLQGPLFLRLLYGHSLLDAAFADAIAEMATRGLLAHDAELTTAQQCGEQVKPTS